MTQFDYTTNQNKPFNLDYVKGALAINNYLYEYSESVDDKQKSHDLFDTIIHLIMNPSKIADLRFLPIVEGLDEKLSKAGLTIKQIPIDAKKPENTFFDSVYCPQYDISKDTAIRVVMISDGPESDDAWAFKRNNWHLNGDKDKIVFGLASFKPNSDKLKEYGII